jgi:hypothetical protein
VLQLPYLFFQLFFDVFGHENIRDGLGKHKPQGTAGILYPPNLDYTTESLRYGSGGSRVTEPLCASSQP